MDTRAVPANKAPIELRPEPATQRLELEQTEVGSVFVSNYPPYSLWNGNHLDAFQGALATPWTSESPPLGLYLHIPFCRKRCKFCYFRLYTDKNAAQVQAYCDALAREIELYGQQPAVAGRPVSFVYFGGGTPSYIAGKHLRELVDRVQAVLPWDRAREIAFECEPGTLSESKLDTIRSIGVTRLSLGVQNFNDHILEINGRAHVSTETYRALPWIRELEFEQLNIDLIAGLIGETWETWRQSVRETIDVGSDSVTIYQMELPYNTRFSRQLMDGVLGTELADWALKREWHAYAFDQLASAGYEISSAYTMVRKDTRGRFLYRDSLWHGADLLGTGVSSFGHLSGVHAQNTASWNSYLERVAIDELPLERAYRTTALDRLTREVILQMKTGSLEVSYFRHKFGVDILEQFGPAFDKLAQQGMLNTTEDTVELTPNGLLQVDMLLPELYAPEHRTARYT